jgi:diguanylate cyclase (GGDEF)-like protein/PAS domain S-box-containing protein
VQEHRAPFWRASLGLLVTVIAGALLVFAVWRFFWLNGRAMGDLASLNRERVAVAYEHQLFDLLVSTERYRLRMELLREPPNTGDIRAQVDRDMAAATNFTQAHGAQFDATGDWSKIQQRWARARNAQRVYRGKDIGAVTADVTNLVYKIEDTSGLEYEPNRYAQDLADVLFAKAPQAVFDIETWDLHTENAQTSGAITIRQRVNLARGIFSVSSDIDLSSDDWSQIVATLPAQHLGTAAKGAQYAASGKIFADTGNKFTDYVTKLVLMRDRPAGAPQQTRALAHAAVASSIAMNAASSDLLDRQLALRIEYETQRNGFVYAIFLLGAVMLIGIVLMVAELTQRRDREALQKAQQESARLSSELARQKAERALRLSEAQFRAVFDGAALGIAILDRSGAVLDANTVFRAVYGEDFSTVLVGHEDEFAELVRGERDAFEFEHHVMTPTGQEAWTDATVSLVNDETGNPYFAICMFRDLTELKRSERRMLHDMTHDSLTGLPNRTFFETKLREQFAEAKASPQSSFAILIVDLDRFKDINESLGHDAGDFVISQIGHRLRASIEAADIVARLGSDEFTVLVKSLPDVLHVEVIARRILSALAKPVALGGRSIFISASVGIAIASGNYARPEDVLRDADIAMRYAKGIGGRFAVFDSNMHARAEKRLQLTTDLRLALEHDEFDLLYQPIVKIADGELVGCEALLRWNHPVEGVMLPSDFMPLAEQTGLAIPVGRYVLRTVCRQLSRWRSGGEALIPLNVNVSATELLDPEFETSLMGAVREFNVDPRDITLEITESVVLDAGSRPNALVERLRGHGFSICIDDFGTGYSSLRYLQQFKVDAIKIDRSFVSGHDGDVASEPIVRTLMTLAEAFDVRVVAEGIETQRQREVLRNAGCRYGQGYYYARALSADEIAAMYPAVFGLTPRHASA